jgi:hypothetical protein
VTQPITAILDGLTLYGADLHLRYSKGMISPTAALISLSVEEAEDCYLDLLHNLLLYDRLLYDPTSFSLYQHDFPYLPYEQPPHLPPDGFGELYACPELYKLMSKIRNNFPNISSSNDGIFNVEWHDRQWARVFSIVCRLIASLPDQEVVRSIKTPIGYQKGLSFSHNEEVKIAERHGLDHSLLPACQFAMKGIGYIGYANRRSNDNGEPTVYLASPGRLGILRLLLSGEDIKRIAFVKQGYGDLLKELPLPQPGYDFRSLSSFMAHELSALTFHLLSFSPDAAYNELLKLRNSQEASKIRGEWQEVISSRSNPGAMGRERLSQSIKNSTIHGSVSMIIHASPCTGD